MSVTSTKTIRVSSETQGALRQLGLKGDSYDDVIRRLVALAGICRARHPSLLTEAWAEAAAEVEG